MTGVDRDDMLQTIEMIRSSGLFMERWYLRRYPDVAEEGVDPIEHFLSTGFSEGRLPNPFFDTSWYAEVYSDVAESGLNPLVHFIEHGANEGRNPGPLFNTDDYLSRHPELVAAGVNPLAHYLTRGCLEGRLGLVELDEFGRPRADDKM